MSIDTIYNDIVKLLDDKQVGNEVGIDPISRVITVEITWGDWKHDHLCCDFLVGDYLNSHSVHYMKSETLTEEDGSDTYSSIHYYHILGEVS